MTLFLVLPTVLWSLLLTLSGSPRASYGESLAFLNGRLSSLAFCRDLDDDELEGDDRDELFDRESEVDCGLSCMCLCSLASLYLIL